MPSVLSKKWDDSFFSSSSDTITLDKGDSTKGLLVYALICRDNDNTDPHTVPSEFEFVQKQTTNEPYCWLYRIKRTSGLESTSWDFEFTGTEECAGLAIAYEGVYWFNEDNDPEEDISNLSYQITDTTLRAGSVTTTEKGSTLLKLGAVNVSTSLTVSTQSSGWTIDFNTHDTGGDHLLYAARFHWTANKGAYGNIDCILSNSVTRKHAFAIAVRQLPPLTPILGTPM